MQHLDSVEQTVLQRTDAQADAAPLIDGEAPDGMCPKQDETIIILPPTFFYPFPNNIVGPGGEASSRQEWSRPESFCLHHWAQSWTRGMHDY
jgi:hypothetical protein